MLADYLINYYKIITYVELKSLTRRQDIPGTAGRSYLLTVELKSLTTPSWAGPTDQHISGRIYPTLHIVHRLWRRLRQFVTSHYMDADLLEFIASTHIPVFYYYFCECLLCSEHSTDAMELRPRLPSLGNTLNSLERIRPCDTRFLASEAVEGTSLAFQGVDDNHGCDSLSLGMLGVGDGITMTFSGRPSTSRTTSPPRRRSRSARRTSGAWTCKPSPHSSPSTLFYFPLPSSALEPRVENLWRTEAPQPAINESFYIVTERKQ